MIEFAFCAENPCNRSRQTAKFESNYGAYVQISSNRNCFITSLWFIMLGEQQKEIDVMTLFESRFRLPQHLFSLVLFVSLAACGGGGSGDSPSATEIVADDPDLVDVQTEGGTPDVPEIPVVVGEPEVGESPDVVVEPELIEVPEVGEAPDVVEEPEVVEASDLVGPLALAVGESFEGSVPSGDVAIFQVPQGAEVILRTESGNADLLLVDTDSPNATVDNLVCIAALPYEEDICSATLPDGDLFALSLIHI